VNTLPEPYSEITRRYFDAAPNAGILHGLSVGSGSAGSQAKGTWVRFDVQILQQHMTAARFQAFGCPHVIAIAAWLTETSVGRAAQERLPETVHALQRRFDVPAEKLGRLLVIEDAWISAIRAAVTKSRSALE
jgi:NifU-like protein involved in Fe-S cluster formation